MKISEIELDPEKMYFLIPYSNGDVFINIFFIRFLEKKLSSEIVLIIKEKQKFIAEMLNAAFVCADFNENDVFEFVPYTSMIPKKGKIFIAHPTFHKELYPDGFFPMFLMGVWKRIFEIPSNMKIDFHFPIPDLLPTIAEKVKNIAPLDRIVLFSPQAVSVPVIPQKYWEDLALKLKTEGFTVLSSVLNEKQTVKGTIFIPMNCQEALSLAYHCHAVYVLRSGFADMCFQLGKKLTVFYPSYETFKMCRMDKCFNRNDINEFVIERGNKKTVKLYLFNKISCACFVFDDISSAFYFLGIPIFQIKNRINKKFFYLLGVPVFKIKVKEEFVGKNYF